MAVPVQYGNQRGHHLVVTAFCFRPLFLAHALSIGALFPVVAASVSAIKVVGQQLRYSKDGQDDGDVRCTLKVL